MNDLTTEDLLIALIEECGEVIQAATKCLRFGYNRDWPGYGVNHEVLARELGDLIGVKEGLALDQDIVDEYRLSKINRIKKWKAYMLAHPVKTP